MVQIEILPLQQGGCRLVRVYGEQPCINIPDAVPAPTDGTRLEITELGDYCFSQSPRALPAPDKTCRYAITQTDNDFDVRPVCIFGRLLGSACRYDLDFGDAPAVPQELHAVCGNFLEEVVLPQTLRIVGSCAFYNCRCLRQISIGSGALTMGSDVFLNCFALELITVRAMPEQPTGLFAVVNNITEAVQAQFAPQGEPIAALWYPAYWEDIEETPAHILLHTFSGQGYHYRQCFLNDRVSPAEYDAIFPQGHDADDADVMAMLCFGRLRFPWQLGDAARCAYRRFLAENALRVLKRLLKAQDEAGVRALTELDVMEKAAFEQAAVLAAKADNAAVCAILADAQHKKYAAADKRPRYDFDF